MSTPVVPALPALAPAPAAPPAGDPRAALVRRGLLLNRFSLAYNVAEAVLALGAGFASGSVALLGFGADSVIEVAGTLAARWRLRADGDAARRAAVEHRALRVIGGSFLALAAYVTAESADTLWHRAAPEASWFGVGLLAVSAAGMPVLARAKRRVAWALGSGTLAADATQTSLCAWLSAIALAGVALNALAGWWWADAVAALAMVPIIAREGWAAVRGRSACADCAHHAPAHHHGP